MPRRVCFSSWARSFAVLDRFERAADVAFVLRERFGDALFEFGDALALALDPLFAQRAAFLLEAPRLLGQVALHLLDGVTAAMQIGDESGGFARFGRDQGAGALDNGFAASRRRRAIAMPLEPPGTPTRRR